jgi:hypothetical protein
MTPIARADEECTDVINECTVIIDNAYKTLQLHNEVIAAQGEQIQDLKFQRDFFKGVAEEPPAWYQRPELTVTGTLVVACFLFGKCSWPR